MKNNWFSKSHFCILFLLSLITICFLFLTETPAQTTSNKEEKLPAKPQLISAIDTDKTGYFPKEFWRIGERGLDKIRLYYSAYLKAASEKSLIVAINDDIEVYRFLKIASRRGKNFIIRLEKRGDKIRLFSTEVPTAASYKILAPDVFSDQINLKNNETKVSIEDFNQFLSLLEKANYEQMPMKDFENLGNDGEEWILESVKNSRYHIVDRWSPDGTNFSEACLYLRKLSGIEDN